MYKISDYYGFICYADVPGLGDVPDLLNSFLPGVNADAVEGCSSQSDELNKLVDACIASLEGGTINVCTKECNAFYTKLGEGDCGDLYKGFGLGYILDACKDGKLTSEDFEDIASNTGVDIPIAIDDSAVAETTQSSSTYSMSYEKMANFVVVVLLAASVF